jgi:TatD DNase family protein
MLVDSHCHLDFDVFDDDRDAMIRRAAEAGIGTMVTICTHLSKFEDVRAIAAAHECIWCTVGIHPHQVETEGVAPAERLIELSADPLVVGIGETGLDYYYDRSPREDQRANFRAHVRAARETGLPLIVHTRDADEDMAEILLDEAGQGGFPGVLHCFSSGRALAETALELGFYISLSGIVTFRNAEDLRAIARDVPLDRMLVETDSPFLAPVPKRGKRNEPAFVVHTARAVAELKNVDEKELADTTTRNFFRLFAKAVAPGAPAS